MSKIIQFPGKNKEDKAPQSKNSSDWSEEGVYKNNETSPKIIFYSMLAVMIVSSGGIFWSLSQGEKSRTLSSVRVLKSTAQLTQELKQDEAQVSFASPITTLDTLRYGVLQGNYNLVVDTSGVIEVKLQAGRLPIKMDYLAFLRRYKSNWSIKYSQVTQEESGIYILKNAQGQQVGKVKVLSSEQGLQSLKMVQ